MVELLCGIPLTLILLIMHMALHLTLYLDPLQFIFLVKIWLPMGCPKKKVDLFSFSHSFILIFALVEPTAKVPTSNAIWDHYGGAPIWLRW